MSLQGAAAQTEVNPTLPCTSRTWCTRQHQRFSEIFFWFKKDRIIGIFLEKGKQLQLILKTGTRNN